MQRLVVTALSLILAVSLTARADEGWQPLFNGRDLGGWVNVNTPADNFIVRDGMIVCFGKSFGFMRTTRMYENYELELEWRHVTHKGNAGLLIHADPLPQIGGPFPECIEVQVRDTDHGSIFGIRGAHIKPLTNPRISPTRARAQPTEERAKPAGEWNHYRLVCRDGNLELAVNGKVVTRAANATQVKGYIGLESEFGEAHFRNIRIRELPPGSPPPPPEKIAPIADQGLHSIFDGVSFAGWKYDDANLAKRWEADNGHIRLRADQPPRDRKAENDLWTEKSYRNFVLVADWRLTAKPVRKQMNAFTDDGLFKLDASGKRMTHEVNHAGDSGIYLRGDKKAQVNIWSQPMGSGDINPYHKDANLSPELRRATMPAVHADKAPGEWNRFIITMQDDRVTVVLNGQTVIDNAHLPGVATEGPIGLQNHGDPIEFRNLFVKELP